MAVINTSHVILETRRVDRIQKASKNPDSSSQDFLYIHNMNKLIFCTSVSIALFFAACGDDSSSVEPSLDESSSSITESSSSTDAQKTSSSSSVENSSSAKSSSSTKASSSTERVGEMTDSRDGQTYKTTTIGPQTWMAENLNYETADSYCYKDSTEYCEKYGRLYTWAAAMVACPSGWRLPTRDEFETLISVSGGLLKAGKVLRSTSGWPMLKWDGYLISTDDYSFSALPAGTRFSDGSYGYEGIVVDFWSSTEDNSHDAYYMNISSVNDCVGLDYTNKGSGSSVRCIKE